MQQSFLRPVVVEDRLYSATSIGLDGTGVPKNPRRLAQARVHSIAAVPSGGSGLVARLALASLVALTLLTASRPAGAASSAQPLDLESADRLHPGQFIWQPERSADGAVSIVVSLPEQRAYVYRGGVQIAASTVSTGKRGHRTPAGVYPILEKQVMHHSNLYNDAPMPFMQRLTMGGVALHAGKLPGYPASHGCVRLPREFSRLLFDVTERGSTAVIANESLTTALSNYQDVMGLAQAKETAPATLPATGLLASDSATDKSLVDLAKQDHANVP